MICSYLCWIACERSPSILIIIAIATENKSIAAIIVMAPSFEIVTGVDVRVCMIAEVAVSSLMLWVRVKMFADVVSALSFDSLLTGQRVSPSQSWLLVEVASAVDEDVSDRLLMTRAPSLADVWLEIIGLKLDAVTMIYFVALVDIAWAIKVDVTFVSVELVINAWVAASVNVRINTRFETFCDDNDVAVHDWSW